MVKIIRFPGSAQRTKVAETSSNPVDNLIVGPMAFTCTNCGTGCRANFDRMVFRTVEFHCASCGTFFKVNNPAFFSRRRT